MVKKSTHVGCNVRGAVSIAGVNGSYILQERGHIHSKHTMFFIHENGLYTLARFKIEGKSKNNANNINNICSKECNYTYVIDFYMRVYVYPPVYTHISMREHTCTYDVGI